MSICLRRRDAPARRALQESVLHEKRLIDLLDRSRILANRRRIAPRGIAGGGDALPGVNRVERANGSVETLSATASVAMNAGDVFMIETPGGGGYGFFPLSQRERATRAASASGVRGYALPGEATPLTRPGSRPTRPLPTGEVG